MTTHHTHMYTHGHTHAYTGMHTCTPTHVHICVCMRTHVCTHTVYTHMHAPTCAHAHACTHTHAPVTGAFVWGSLGRGKLSLGASLQPLWTEAVGWGSLAQGWWGGSSSPAFVLSLRCGCSPQSTGPGAGSPAGHNGVCVPPEGQRAGHAEAGAVSGNPGLDSC